MLGKTRRRLTVSVLTLAVLAPSAIIAQPASAWPKGHSIFEFKYKVVATTHIKKSDMTLTAPPGVFVGGIDLNTGQLKGKITLPPTSFTTSINGIGNVTATAATEQVKPVTGKVNFNNFKVTSTSVFNIHITKMYVDQPTLPSLPGLPPIKLPWPKVNLVGDHCITSSPVKVTMSGVAHFGEPSTFKGTFSIPDFVNCGAATTVVNQQTPGPGNTFSATASPL